MTSPPVPSSDVVAEMAITGTIEHPPEVDLTAVETSQAEVNATLPPIATPERIQIEENATETEGEVKDEVVTEVQHVKVEEEPRPIVITEDAAIPATEHDLQQDLSAVPISIADFSQMGPIDSLLAYAQPFPLLPPVDYGLSLPNDLGVVQEPFLEASPYIHEQDETRISAYAKLEFSDGEFYMNTYSVILGRDQKAMREALRREQEERKRIDEEASAHREPKTPVHMRRDHSKYSKSVVSESGGILREVDDLNLEKRRKVGKKSKSTGSSSKIVSRRNSIIQPTKTFDYQAQPIASHNATENGARPNLAALRPDPHDCPLVNIHPPATESVSGYKAISRQHVKIAYSLKKHLFEAHILGRNGAFVEEIFYHEGEVVDLKSGSYLQIGEVMVRFVLPDVALGETGADQQRANYEDNPISDRYSEGGKEMSFDFEESIHDGIVRETSSSSDERPASDDEDQNIGSGDERQDQDVEMMDGSEQSSDEEEEEEEEPEKVIPTTESIAQHGLIPGKKRGPGRPPKDGIMSKREKQLVKKAAKAAAEGGQALADFQAQLLTQSPVQVKSESVPQGSPTAKKNEVKTEVLPDGTVVPVKNKVGRPRKHPRPDTPPIQREKRKYTKRKPKEPKEGEGKEGGSGGEEAKEKKKDKPTKPPRSPSPTFNEADLTPEQLAKPQANYVTLIHEALSSSAAGMMSLPQIYRAIMRKYPFFVLKCSTTGWQSSVRHNLSQHHAFKKVERDGKGWMWAIVEGVSIEKEKKRRVTPPPSMAHGQMHHQPIYQAGHPPHMMPGQYPIPPPGYMLHPNLRPGQPYMGPPMNGHPYPHGPPPMHINPHQHAPPGLFPGIPQIAAIAPPQQYSSPYGPKPGATQPPPPTPNPPNVPQLNPAGPPFGAAPVRTPSTEQKSSSVPNSSSVGTPATTSSTNPPAPASQHQSPYQNHSHPHPSLSQNVPMQSAPQQPRQPAPAVPPPPSRPQHHQSVINAVEAFRSNLLASLKDKTENAEAILNSAVNRALGYTKESSVPGDNFEPRIFDALQTILVTIPEYKPVHAALSSLPLPIQPPNGAQMSQAHNPHEITNRNTPQAQGSAAPAVMRPSFSGVSVPRPSANTIPRPSMTTPGASPGLLRVKSASPAVAQLSQPATLKAELDTSITLTPPAQHGLPAGAEIQASTEAAAGTHPVTQPSQVTTNVDLTVNPAPAPPFVTASDEKSATATAATSIPVTSNAADSGTSLITAASILAPPPAAQSPPIPQLTAVGQMPSQAGTKQADSGLATLGQKRQIDEVDGGSEGELPDFKRAANSGPPPLKT